jgi:hypothetical protein
MSRSNDSGY